MTRWIAPVAALALLVGCGSRNEESSSRDTASDSSAVMHEKMNRQGGGMMGDSSGMMGHGMMGDMASMNHMMVETLGPADSAYDQRFIDLMIPHHQGAIDMASRALSAAVHPELKSLAKNIIDGQQKEIEKMRSWRGAWYGASAPAGSMESPAMMKKMNMSMIAGLGPNDSLFDERFIDMMIPHHEGAIAMAQDALGKSSHAEIKDLARGIMASQQKEIDQMKKWRQQWYGK